MAHTKQEPYGCETPVCRSNPISYVSSPIVTITVGTSQKQYYAHKALLTNYSPYFEACLEPAFSEGRNLKVDLPDDNESALHGFINWLYTGNLDGLYEDVSSISYDAIEVYRLADKLQIPELKNVSIDHARKYFRKTKSTPYPTNILMLEQYCLLDSKFCQFFVRHFVWSICNQPERWDKDAEFEGYQIGHESMQKLYESTEASIEVLKCFVKYQRERWRDPIYADDCDYHEHDNGKRCVSTRPAAAAAADPNEYLVLNATKFNLGTRSK